MTDTGSLIETAPTFVRIISLLRLPPDASLTDVAEAVHNTVSRLAELEATAQKAAASSMDHITSARDAVRSVGLCGKQLSDASLCILPRGHDDSRHERWSVVVLTKQSAFPSDSRDAVASHRVLDYTGKLFETENGEHAQWLAATLTRLGV